MTALAIPSLNLMPAARVAAARRGRRARAWVTAIVAYAVVAGGVWGFCGMRGAQAGGVSQELAEVNARIERLKGEVKAQELSLAVAQRELEAAREVRNHPDLSVLVNRISQATGPLITLDRLEVRPIKVEDKIRKSDLVASQGYTLKLTGLSSDQVDVPRFGKALQDLGIFETISVVGIRAKESAIRFNSKGDAIRTPQLYAFDIEAVFSDKGAASSQAGGGGH